MRLRSPSGRACVVFQRRMRAMVGKKRTRKSTAAHGKQRGANPRNAPMKDHSCQDREEVDEGGNDRAGHVCGKVFRRAVGLRRDEVNHRGPDAESDEDSGEPELRIGVLKYPKNDGRRSQRSESGLERQSAKENEARGPFVTHANELGHVFSGRRRNAEAAEIADNGSDVAHVDDVSRFRRTESTRNRDGRDDSDDRADDVLNAVPARVLRDCFRVRHGAAGLCSGPFHETGDPKRIRAIW